MKTQKKVLGIVLFLFSVHYGFSQPIAVSFSLIREKGADIFIEDSVVCVPKLCVTYRNNSDENYYFMKVSNNPRGIPQIGCLWMFQYPIEEYRNPNYRKRAMMHSNYAQDHYNVYISCTPHVDNDWLLLNDTINYETDEIEDDIINCDLGNIYKYIALKEYSIPREAHRIFFSISDIEPDRIVQNKNKFVFLSPKEVFIDTFHLIGFQEVGGAFTFRLGKDSLPDYVYLQSFWNNETGRFESETAPLPKKVNGYQLYSGKITSDTVTISFPGILRKYEEETLPGSKEDKTTKSD